MRLLAAPAVVLLALLSVFLVTSFPVVAEPHGHAILSAEWSDAPGSGLGPDERVLRLLIRTAAPLEGSELAYHAPAGVILTPRAPAGDVLPPAAAPGPDGAPRLALQRLTPHRTRMLEFVVRVPQGEAGTAVFTLHGETASGRQIREAVGWNVGTAAEPLSRHGAAEFPARVVAEDPR